MEEASQATEMAALGLPSNFAKPSRQQNTGRKAQSQCRSSGSNAVTLGEHHSADSHALPDDTPKGPAVEEHGPKRRYNQQDRRNGGQVRHDKRVRGTGQQGRDRQAQQQQGTSKAQYSSLPLEEIREFLP